MYLSRRSIHVPAATVPVYAIPNGWQNAPSGHVEDQNQEINSGFSTSVTQFNNLIQKDFFCHRQFITSHRPKVAVKPFSSYQAGTATSITLGRLQPNMNATSAVIVSSLMSGPWHLICCIFCFLHLHSQKSPLHSYGIPCMALFPELQCQPLYPKLILLQYVPPGWIFMKNSWV